MKKILTILLFTIFIVSCTNQTGKPQDINYYQGTQGLEMRWLENAPPNQIYDNQFEVGFELKNKGAFPIWPSTARFYLTGYDQSIMAGQWREITVTDTLERRSDLNPEGGYEVKTIPFFIRSYNFRDKYQPQLQLTAIYNYLTDAQLNVCVDPTPFGQEIVQEVCTPQDVSGSGGQGAPVAVTNIEVIPATQKIYLKIHVSNVGGGTVIRPDKSTISRIFDLRYDDTNIVAFDPLIGVKLSDLLPAERCSPKDGILRLPNGQDGIITCSFNIPYDKKTAYTAPLRVVLSYLYMDSITKPINIIKPPETTLADLPGFIMLKDDKGYISIEGKNIIGKYKDWGIFLNTDNSNIDLITPIGTIRT